MLNQMIVNIQGTLIVLGVGIVLGELKVGTKILKGLKVLISFLYTKITGK